MANACRPAARIDVEDNGPGIPPGLLVIRCSTRWSAVAKAALACYLMPAILSINTPAKLNLPVGQYTGVFGLPADSEIECVYATRYQSGVVDDIVPSVSA